MFANVSRWCVRGTAFARVLLCLIASGFASHSIADEWWNEAWPYRTGIAIDTSASGANIAEPIGRATILVRLHSGNFSFKDVKPDGSDLRFIAADQRTVLSHHIESFDAVAEQAMVWLDIPELMPAAKQTIYVYYGAQEPVVPTSPAMLYGEEQLLVYHFASQGGPVDSTRYNNHATTAVSAAPNALIGEGIALDGLAYIQLPATPSLTFAPGQALTISLWMKPAPVTPTSSGSDATSQNQTAVLFDAPGVVRVGLRDGIPYAAASVVANDAAAIGRTAVASNSWTHIAVRLGEQISLFVNGELVNEVPRPNAGTRAAARLGAAAEGPPGRFKGEMDELQIAAATLSSGQILLAARNQGVDSRLLNFAPAEQQVGGASNYMQILLEAVTIDGWVVIILLGVMAVISWWVMIGKVLYVSAAERANSAFLELYRREIVRGEPGARLDGNLAPAGHRSVGARAVESEKKSGDDKQLIANAPLYRLYRVGVDEMAATLPRQQREDSTPAHVIALLRSALDAGLVREGRRLNRAMVLLTIAISGGPFLGLLGTVVGVMITFAAIAAAGDVNINSIAPGIAAALVATVAGLAVAIPALFGYNYLTSRIEEINGEMQIFVDDFEKRVAAGQVAGA